MKINRHNPKHWILLAGFGLMTLLALVIRPFLRSNPRSVLLYGHKLNGNLLSLYNESLTSDYGLQLDFLTMDPEYHQSLCRQDVSSILATSPRAAWRLAKATSIVTDHGLHVMTLLPLLTNIQFFDVWHGIPFKGFDAEDFRTQHRYRETWVTSPMLKQIYIERFGFKADQVVVTGYARTDPLIKSEETSEVVRKRLGLPVNQKLILFAPTWAQDNQGRSIYPFGTDEKTFMTALSQLAEESQCNILLRPHLNTPLNEDINYPNVHVRASATHPNTEEILLASDILVCDWSSIAFDYLLLDRPTVFLDVHAPFQKGLSLGPEYRFGEVVAGLDTLIKTLRHALADPISAVEQERTLREKVKQAVYADKADGDAAKRGIQRLCQAKA